MTIFFQAEEKHVTRAVIRIYYTAKFLIVFFHYSLIYTRLIYIIPEFTYVTRCHCGTRNREIWRQMCLRIVMTPCSAPGSSLYHMRITDRYLGRRTRTYTTMQHQFFFNLVALPPTYRLTFLNRTRFYIKRWCGFKAGGYLMPTESNAEKAHTGAFCISVCLHYAITCL